MIDMMQNRRLNDSPTSVLSSHAGCARSNATLRPLLMTVDASVGGASSNTSPSHERGVVPLTFGVKPGRRMLDLILPLEYHWVMHEPVLALRTNP
ncbi:hypothetical protein J3E69DRAFT_78703 [Trichoderma sp. SZMC 28015]